MSKTLIDFYYQIGVYNIDKMVQLVKQGELSERQFYQITRLNYKAFSRKEK